MPVLVLFLPQRCFSQTKSVEADEAARKISDVLSHDRALFPSITCTETAISREYKGNGKVKRELSMASAFYLRYPEKEGAPPKEWRIPHSINGNSVDLKTKAAMPYLVNGPVAWSGWNVLSPKSQSCLTYTHRIVDSSGGVELTAVAGAHPATDECKAFPPSLRGVILADASMHVLRVELSIPSETAKRFNFPELTTVEYTGSTFNDKMVVVPTAVTAIKAFHSHSFSAKYSECHLFAVDSRILPDAEEPSSIAP
jgi:hypothetical protein